MSEEEIIEECKRIIFEYGWIRESVDGKNEDLRALGGLLDLYQKEKKKNKEFFNGEKFTRKQIEIVLKAIKEGIEEQVPKEMKNFISKDKIREKLLGPIRKEANEINKIFFEKDKGFEVEGAVLQELGAIEGMILKLLED